MSEESLTSESGTIIRAPVAPPTGKTGVPAGDYVAVKTVAWYKSVTLWGCAALPFVDFAADLVLHELKLDGKTHHAIILALSIYLGWRRIAKNTVIA